MAYQDIVPKLVTVAPDAAIVVATDSRQLAGRGRAMGTST